ncbi:hypothetical protein P3X46_031822 [Hevea brasiliensis]|uniref:Eukaryotic translation initiation factor 3 30 kDa subunit n=1 Tax=Hevea brasiliensis TaxID=3981 RepID=A0ABQ9KNJ8_HEVBR|nr:hypothetical protein P3X46_031822 [Hevea brasiliensis]
MLIEDEQIPPLLAKEQPKSKWDDEDVDEIDVKESWEDEDEPALVPVAKPTPEKSSKKPVAKSTEKKGRTVEVPKEEAQSLDPVAEKLRQQRLVEEADYRSTIELFAKRGDEKTLDNFIPKFESDFLEYVELISHKLHPYEYIGLLKAVMRLSMTSLKAADAKDVASSKKQLRVDKPDDDLVVDAYDALDDYDFM